MKIVEHHETPREKGKRLFESGRVSLIKEDDFEILFRIKGNYRRSTEVSFIKKSYEIKCFNKECSLWRGSDKTKPRCYHSWAIHCFLNDRYKRKLKSKIVFKSKKSRNE